MLPTFFSFDRCTDDCAKREEMRTPGETGFWGGGAGGSLKEVLYREALTEVQFLNSLPFIPSKSHTMPLFIYL